MDSDTKSYKSPDPGVMKGLCSQGRSSCKQSLFKYTDMMGPCAHKSRGATVNSNCEVGLPVHGRDTKALAHFACQPMSFPWLLGIKAWPR